MNTLYRVCLVHLDTRYAYALDQDNHFDIGDIVYIQGERGFVDDVVYYSRENLPHHLETMHDHEEVVSPKNTAKSIFLLLLGIVVVGMVISNWPLLLAGYIIYKIIKNKKEREDLRALQLDEVDFDIPLYQEKEVEYIYRR